MALHPRRSAAAVVAGLAILVLTAPPPTTAAQQLARAGTAVDPTGPLVAAVALSAWAVTAWLALTVALVLLSRLPGLLGRTVGVLTGCIAPAAVRRAVEAALGLTVVVGVLAPTAAFAAPALAAPVPGPTAAVSGLEGWDLDWPSRGSAPTTAAPPSDAARPTGPGSGASSTPSPRVPAPSTVRPSSLAPSTPAPSPPAPSTRAPRTPAPRAAVPTGPTAAPDVPALAPPTPPTPEPGAAGALAVRSGDSLWSIAAASLRAAGTASPTDAQVARAWPRWWAANREAVGDDPDLLLPGTVLHPPADGPGGR